MRHEPRQILLARTCSAPPAGFTLLRSAGSHPVRAASAHRILYAGWSACNRIGAPEHHLAELLPSRYNFEDMPNRLAPGSPECHLSPPSRHSAFLAMPPRTPLFQTASGLEP